MINELKVTLAAKGVVKVVGCGGCGKGGGWDGPATGRGNRQGGGYHPGQPKGRRRTGKAFKNMEADILCAATPL